MMAPTGVFFVPLGTRPRAVAFGALALLLGLGVEAGLWTQIALIAVCALMVWTIFKRAAGALVEAEAENGAATTQNP